MASKTLDLRGLDCPAPVVETKKAFAENDWTELHLLIDSEIARGNVRRFAERRDARVEESAQGLRILRDGTARADGETAASAPRPEGRLVVYANSRLMGHGDEALGEILVRGFFKTLLDARRRPDALVFVQQGIFLSTEGSPVLDSLKALEAEGCEILSCGTCLDFYHRKETLAVGRVSNMYEIVESLTEAASVITP